MKFINYIYIFLLVNYSLVLNQNLFCMGLCNCFKQKKEKFISNLAINRINNCSFEDLYISEDDSDEALSESDLTNRDSNDFSGYDICCKSYKPILKNHEKLYNFLEFKKKCDKLPSYKSIIEFFKLKKQLVDINKKNNFNYQEFYKYSYSKTIELDDFKDVLKDYILKLGESSIANKDFWFHDNVPSVIGQYEGYISSLSVDCLSGYKFLDEMLLGVVSNDQWMQDNDYNSFFFAQKIILPKDSKLKIIGDRHGDIKSLNMLFDKWICKGYIGKDLKIKRKNLYVCFLGDYVDRGYSGCEVLYLLQRFKAANWDKVHLIRGNHENLGLNYNNGFLKEIYFKYKKCKDFGLFFPKIRYLINRFYCSLPSAIYVQIDKSKEFILLCHGAIDPRFDPAKIQDDNRSCVFQKIDNLTSVLPIDDFSGKDIIGVNPNFPRYKYFCSNINCMKDLSCNDKSISSIYFVSGDFNFSSKKEENLVDILEDEESKRFALGKRLVLDLCAKTRVKAIFRGHQHHEDYGNMIGNLISNFGIYNLWSENHNKQLDNDNKPENLANFGPVWTLIAAPECGCGDYYKYNFDTYVTLKIGENFDNCTIVRSKLEAL